MIYGYARVSTEEQNLDGQILELEKLGCETIVVEKVSGKNLKRPELQTLISSLQKNDVLIVVKIDRLARSLIDLIFLLSLSLIFLASSKEPRGKGGNFKIELFFISR